jgi:hypothetical protein
MFLNRSNKLPNQQTEISFEIENSETDEARIYCYLKGGSELHKIILVERNRDKIWERGGYTKFKNFENFLAVTANRVESEIEPFKHRPSPQENLNLIKLSIDSEIAKLTLYVL